MAFMVARWGGAMRSRNGNGPATTGDHKGPPFPTLPPSPLRTDDDVSNKLTPVSPTPVILRVSLAIILFCSLKDR